MDRAHKPTSTPPGLIRARSFATTLSGAPQSNTAPRVRLRPILLKKAAVATQRQQ